MPRAVRDLTHQWTYNDLDSLAALFDAHRGDSRRRWSWSRWASKHPRPGSSKASAPCVTSAARCLIFDEVITGFRLAPGGAQEYFGVLPDLAVFGKAMANGYPLAAVAGSVG